MNVLYLVNGFPGPDNPQTGVFVKAQIDSLAALGVRPTVALVRGKKAYARSLLSFPDGLRPGVFDLIHAHYSFAAAPVLFRRTPPLVVSFMGSDLNGDYNVKAFGPYRAFLKTYGRMVARRADAVICKSEQLAAQLPVPPHVIPNGVDFDLFRPLAKDACRSGLGWEKDVRYVCFAGAPGKIVKNYPLAEAAVNEVRRRTGDDVRLHIADGMPQDEYVRVLNACDVLLFTSRAEGSPNVVKEALACAKPVVTVDVGDVGTHLGGVVNCRVVPGYDAALLGRALADALDGAPVTDGRQKAAYLRMPVVAERIMDVYREVLGG